MSQKQSSGTASSQTASPRTARKSIRTHQVTPVDRSASYDDTADTSGAAASQRTSRKSTGARPITPMANTSSVNANSGAVSQTLFRTTRKSTATHPIAPANCSTLVKDHSVGNLDNLVNKCVSYILVADQKKYAIKKQDIIKNVFEHQDSKLFKSVLDKACNILKKTFGLEILGIENRKNQYMLVNIIDRELVTREFAEYSPAERQKQGLVFYLLTLIYMNENVIGEDELWDALKPFGIDVNSQVPDIVFGDMKKYITVELVKQMYLDYRCICKDPPQYEFVWGPRAKQEVSKEDLLEFACKVTDTKPQDWVYQYHDAVSKVDEQE